jgi:hypothetical protein
VTALAACVPSVAAGAALVGLGALCGRMVVAKIAWVRPGVISPVQLARVLT